MDKYRKCLRMLLHGDAWSDLSKVSPLELEPREIVEIFMPMWLIPSDEVEDDDDEEALALEMLREELKALGYVSPWSEDIPRLVNGGRIASVKAGGFPLLLPFPA